VEDSPHSISVVGQQQQQSFDCKDSVLQASPFSIFQLLEDSSLLQFFC
jgi:hypothetical protein